MEKVFYTRKNCPVAPTGYNNGEKLEWKVGYELTGTPNARNNKPATDGGDIGGIQVKSPKASLASVDRCDSYIFGFADEDFYYAMSIGEFETFVNEFGYVDYDTHTGKQKVRIKGKSSKMLRWLDERA